MSYLRDSNRMEMGSLSEDVLEGNEIIYDPHVNKTSPLVPPLDRFPVSISRPTIRTYVLTELGVSIRRGDDPHKLAIHLSIYPRKKSVDILAVNAEESERAIGHEETQTIYKQLLPAARAVGYRITNPKEWEIDQPLH